MNDRLLRPALVSLALVGVAGCTVQNLGTVEVAAMCAPTQNCEFTPTCANSDALGAPVVDFLNSDYTFLYPFQFNNERVNNSSSGTTGGVTDTNTNDATIEQFLMTYEAPGYNLPSATSPQFATVPAAGSTTVVVILIPQAAGLALTAALPATQTEVIVHFRASGHFADGATFETGEYLVPVTVSHEGLYAPCPGGTLVSACPNTGQSAIITCQ